ncbi:MAG TPA: sigma-70 family RNA polymerase sigma factor [Ktedonosporobacter sp.]|nr:sigma-70 family RNA polymerase sigma factor [Ktedonosporobacter sp.]
MNKHEWLAEQFEANRTHLQAVAYRMLGSLSEADDAVQESWLRLSRSDTSGIENLGGWLTTVVGRICLDMLRSRNSRREESLEATVSEFIESSGEGSDPEQEVLLADSLGLALLIVLDTLPPAERIAFVLHDIFAVPFDEIAPIVERSETATRQLASRARRRVRGAETAKRADLERQRAVVDAFLAASRNGNFEALLTVLDPEVVFRSDHVALQKGEASSARGASVIARQFVGRAKGVRTALVDGAVAAIVASRRQLFLVLNFTIKNDKIVEIEAITDPARLHQLHPAVIDN